MRAKVIPLRPKKDIREIVDAAFEEHLRHLKPEVSSCLRSELEVLLHKHFDHETPELTLTLPQDLSETQFELIRHNFRNVLEAYNDLVTARANLLFRDLYLARLEICQLKYDRQDNR